MDSTTYEKIARNVPRMNAVSLVTREGILARAEKELPEDVLKKINELKRTMEQDREVYRLAELDYSRGPPEGQKLFVSAIADYYLRHKELLEPQ